MYKKFNRSNASAPIVLSKIRDLLVHIDPGCPYELWSRVLMAIKYETHGSEAGFALADDWSCDGANYRGTDDVRRTWKYLKVDHVRPVTMGTLNWMAKHCYQ